MPIKNYTSKVPVFRTVAEIHKLLIAKGARAIISEYAEDSSGDLRAISFKLMVNDRDVIFRLPGKEEGVYRIMYSGKNSRLSEKDKRTQAARTTWRIIKDWIDSQVALVEADCAEMAEVFLPYALVDKNTTMYESVINDDVKLLT